MMRVSLFNTVATLAAATILSLFVVTCGNRDDRDRIRGDFGEPDQVIAQGIDPFWSETWFYNSAGLAFEFHRTSGCGSLRDVFLYRQYGFVPVPPDSSQPKMLPLPLDKNNPITP